ncbi:MAG: hypothetical protein RL235_6, partial [Chlamydiota bacterium]
MSLSFWKRLSICFCSFLGWLYADIDQVVDSEEPFVSVTLIQREIEDETPTVSAVVTSDEVVSLEHSTVELVAREVEDETASVEIAEEGQVAQVELMGRDVEDETASVEIAEEAQVAQVELIGREVEDQMPATLELVERDIVNEIPLSSIAEASDQATL